MSYNGQNILSLGTSNGEIHTFNLENNQLVHIKTLEPNSAFGPVRVLKFSPNSKILVSGHDVGVLEVRTRFLWKITLVEFFSKSLILHYSLLNTKSRS